MGERWTWRCSDAAGRSVPDVAAGPFPTQADAEAWLSESWAELVDAGVSAVLLRRDGVDVYGPMPLRR